MRRGGSWWCRPGIYRKPRKSHAKTQRRREKRKILNMKLVQLMPIPLLTAGMLVQPASAGPFEALKNFFVRPQPQAHVTHHRPAHPKEAKDAPKDAPNDSPSPVAPPVDQQTNQQTNGAPEQQNAGQQNTGQQNTLNNNNRPGRPALA